MWLPGWPARPRPAQPNPARPAPSWGGGVHTFPNEEMCGQDRGDFVHSKAFSCFPGVKQGGGKNISRCVSDGQNIKYPGFHPRKMMKVHKEGPTCNYQFKNTNAQRNPKQLKCEISCVNIWGLGVAIFFWVASKKQISNAIFPQHFHKFQKTSGAFVRLDPHGRAL